MISPNFNFLVIGLATPFTLSDLQAESKADFRQLENRCNPKSSQKKPAKICKRHVESAIVAAVAQTGSICERRIEGGAFKIPLLSSALVIIHRRNVKLNSISVQVPPEITDDHHDPLQYDRLEGKVEQNLEGAF